MATFAEKEFFGSAIGGAIPQGWIDASSLRDVPDHQEIFLSPTTLSNMIIELNERVKPEDALPALGNTPTLDSSAITPRSGAPATSETEDKAAALYHVRDLCDEDDTMQVISPPRRVTLSKFPSSAPVPVPAYAGVVSYTTPKGDRSAATGRIPVHGEGAAAGSSAAGPQTSTFTCHFLLARLKAQATDLVVFVNVPHEEFDARGDPRDLSREEELASALVGKMVETLEVRNWELFGSG